MFFRNVMIVFQPVSVKIPRISNSNNLSKNIYMRRYSFLIITDNLCHIKKKNFNYPNLVTPRKGLFTPSESGNESKKDQGTSTNVKEKFHFRFR